MENTLDYDAAKLAKIDGLDELQVVEMVESDGQPVFWSRFGGWKFGSSSNDDVSAGYTHVGLWLAHNRPSEIA